MFKTINSANRVHIKAMSGLRVHAACGFSREHQSSRHNAHGRWKLCWSSFSTESVPKTYYTYLGHI